MRFEAQAFIPALATEAGGPPQIRGPVASSRLVGALQRGPFSCPDRTGRLGIRRKSYQVQNLRVTGFGVPLSNMAKKRGYWGWNGRTPLKN